MLASLEVVYSRTMSTMNVELIEEPEPPDIDLSPYLPSYSGYTHNSPDDSSDVENDALSYRCIYTPLPINEMYKMNHVLPSFSQRTVSVIVNISLTAAMAVALAARWELLLERKAEAAQHNIEHSPSAHAYSTTLMVAVKPTLTHFKPVPVCDNILLLMLTLVLFSSVRVIRVFIFPKPVLFKCPFIHKTVLLVLYLGALPTYALPEHRAEQSSLSLSIRQSSTVWTVQLRGWPNTGYCTMMQFGSTKQQMVSL